MIIFLLVKKLLLDPVIISQNKPKFLAQDPKIWLSHKLPTPSRDLYQVMVLDVLSRDLGW